MGDELSEEEPTWRDKLLKRAKQGAVAMLIVLCVACLVVAEYPKVNSIDVAHLAWRKSLCKVLAAGVEYKGTCDISSVTDKYNIRHNNYTACSSFLWCADEGQMCVCRGTVRYGSSARGILTSKFVQVDVDGAVMCATSAFGQDPAAFRRKQCWCRPHALKDITRSTLAPASCDSAVGMEDEVAPTGGISLKEDDQACTRSYLPWALVEVQIENSTHQPEARCAFQYGAAALSQLADTDETLALLRKFNPPTGSLPCYVLDMGTDDEAALGCVVALDRPGNGLLKKWANGWTLHVAWRASVCWASLAVAFFSLAPVVAWRFEMIGHRA